jgi:hypothetical protein
MVGITTASHEVSHKDTIGGGRLLGKQPKSSCDLPGGKKVEFLAIE